MFERTYAARPKEEWERACAAGLDIGPEQESKKYEDTEEAVNKEFMEYCREFRPQLYPILAD